MDEDLMNDNPNEPFGSSANPDLGDPPHTYDEQRRLKKAKRTKVILITAIILLLGVLGGLVFFGYTIYQDAVTKGQIGLKPTTTMPNGVSDPSAPGEAKVDETTIPNLTALFGLSVEEVSTQLGNRFQLTRSEASEDATNPDIKQLAVFSFIPTINGSAPGAASLTSLPTESIYASLDESGKVIDIYYTCDLRLLGYPEQSFNQLLASDMVLVTALQAAGVTTRDDFIYIPPDFELSISYDNPGSENRKIIKQSHTFDGRTSADSTVTAWTLTVSYDFGSGVAEASDYSGATRTIALRLA